MNLYLWIFVRPKLRKYFAFVQSETHGYFPIQEPNKKILRAYRAISLGNDKKLVEEYDRVERQRKKHNQDFEALGRLRKDYPLFYDQYLKDPLNSDSKKELDEYRYGINVLLKEFEPLLPELASFKYEVLDFLDSIPEIERQYCLSLALSKELAVSSNRYFSIREIRLIKEKYSSNNTGKIYFHNLEPAAIEKDLMAKNKLYISDKVNLSLFDSINGRSLDSGQREAVVKEEESHLVIAGAGTGKTLTICGRVRYLLEEKRVSKSDLLLLSYSKNSSDDLKKKISGIDPDISVSTFHSLGLRILNETKGEKQDIEEQYDGIMESFFREEVFRKPDLSQKVLFYYSLYLSNDKKRHYENEGELFRALKEDHLMTLKDEMAFSASDYENKITLKKERVKSYEELAIANFYFINGVNYEYEYPYPKVTSTAKKRQYTPDFYLTDYGIFHEHYGVDRNGRAPQYDPDTEKEYLDSMEWKHQLYAQDQIPCIETYSYEFAEGTIFDELTRLLKNNHVEMHPLSPEKINDCLHSVYGGRYFASFISFVKTFCNLYKSQYRDSAMFATLKNKEFADQYQRSRASLFLDICQSAYEFYYAHLSKEGKIDFDDMIFSATESLDKTPNFRYRYIIVDEFQDISVSRMRFLQKLIAHGNSSLFAVGDDWQAIYRFAGCDLDIFLHFSDYFPDSARSYITNTHRNSSELQDIVEPFITANPEQFQKHLYSDLHLADPVQIIFFEKDKKGAFLRALGLISEENPRASVLVLGRNNKDIEAILGKAISYEKRSGGLVSSHYPFLTLRFKTVHASKGLEEEYVILINGDDDKSGFPNKMEDDPMISLVLSRPNVYEFSEERRLFYVALTRARKRTFILAKRSATSSFVGEIKEKCKIIDDLEPSEKDTLIACPSCKSGHLVMRSDGKGGSFYGCSNYPYCDYSINDLEAVKRGLHCPECGDFLIFKKGRYGAFYGCHGFPNCNYTEKYHKK